MAARPEHGQQATLITRHYPGQHVHLAQHVLHKEEGGGGERESLPFSRSLTPTHSHILLPLCSADGERVPSHCPRNRQEAMSRHQTTSR